MISYLMELPARKRRVRSESVWLSLSIGSHAAPDATLSYKTYLVIHLVAYIVSESKECTHVKA